MEVKNKLVAARSKAGRICRKVTAPKNLSIAAVFGVGTTMALTAKTTIDIYNRCLEKSPDEISGERSLSDKKKVLTDSLKESALDCFLTLGSAFLTVKCITGASRKYESHIRDLQAFNDLNRHRIEKFNMKVFDSLPDAAAGAALTKIGEGIRQEEYPDEEYDVFGNKRDWVYEPISDRYFKASVSELYLGLYEANRNYILRGQECINEWFAFIGLKPVPDGDKIMWVCGDPWMDGYCMIEYSVRKNPKAPGYILYCENEPIKADEEYWYDYTVYVSKDWEPLPTQYFANEITWNAQKEND